MFTLLLCGFTFTAGVAVGVIYRRKIVDRAKSVNQKIGQELDQG